MFSKLQNGTVRVCAVIENIAGAEDV